MPDRLFRLILDEIHDCNDVLELKISSLKSKIGPMTDCELLHLLGELTDKRICIRCGTRHRSVPLFVRLQLKKNKADDVDLIALINLDVYFSLKNRFDDRFTLAGNSN